MNHHRLAPVAQALLAASFLLAFSCASGPGAPAADPQGSWRLVTLAGESVTEAAEGQPTLLLADGTASGVGSCNGYGAAYSLSAGGGIRFTDAWSTKMACEDPGLEFSFFSALASARTWSVSGDMLRLFGEDGAELAAFARATES